MIPIRSLISRRAFLQSSAATTLVALVPGHVSHAVAGSSDLSFLAVGDWGHKNATQRQVAEAMAKIAERDNIRFVISTGDNFYGEGVASTSDPLWKDVFEDVYTAIAERVIATGQAGDVVYAVPGSPLVGEFAVRELLKMSIEVEVIPAESFVDAVLTEVGYDPLDRGLQILNPCVVQR